MQTIDINQEDRLKEYAPLVNRAARNMMVRLPASVQIDDLIQAGMIGLLDAINRYEDSQGAKFETFAITRIKGSMLDELRSTDHISRTFRKNARSIDSAINILEQRLGRKPLEQELANELGLTLANYQEMLQSSRNGQLVYDTDSEQDNSNIIDKYQQDNNSPLDILMDKKFKKSLTDAIENLPDREKTVMGLYYEHELNLGEIGKIMGVGESRVCQLHSQAISKLRFLFKI